MSDIVGDSRKIAMWALRIILLFALLVPSLVPASAWASDPGEEKFIDEVTFDQRLNEQVPLDLNFRDENGQSVRLGEVFSEKPVILLLGYYNCPNLCPLTRDGLVEALGHIADFDVGREYDLLAVSIDPTEGSEVAKRTKAQYVDWYKRAGAEQGMHFWTGEKEEIETLSQAVGFRYGYDTDSKQYAHASGITFLTPAGKIARYAFGIQYDPKDIRLALVDAAENRIGSPVDQLLLLCFHYDPQAGKYTFAIINVLRLAGVATVVILGTALVFLLRNGGGGGPPNLQEAAT